MISAFHVSYKTASKASLIEKGARKELEDSKQRRLRPKETEGKLTHSNKQISNY